MQRLKILWQTGGCYPSACILCCILQRLHCSAYRISSDAGRGAVLGWSAALVILFAATSGFVVFIAARNLLYDWLSAKAGRLCPDWKLALLKMVFSACITAYSAAPFWVVNIVPACVGMSAWQFVVATFIGIASGNLIYVWVAQGFDHIFSRGEVPDLSLLAEPQIILPLAAGGMSLLPVAVKKLKKSLKPLKTGEKMPEISCDVCVIGGGSGAVCCGRCCQMGADTVLFERSEMGVTAEQDVSL